MTKHNRYSAEFKAKAALEAIREPMPAELAKYYDIHPTMIRGWKRTGNPNMEAALAALHPSSRSSLQVRSISCMPDSASLSSSGIFCQQPPISFPTLEAERVEAEYPDLSVRPQCSLLSLARSGL